MSSDPKPSMGTITLIGSGEMSPGMSKTHREVISAVPSPLEPVFLDTPAGFQLNVDQISEKAIRYFKKHFNLNLTIASFKSAKKQIKNKSIRCFFNLKPPIIFLPDREVPHMSLKIGKTQISSMPCIQD